MSRKICTSAFAAVLLIAFGSLTSQQVAADPIGMVVDDTNGSVHVFDAGTDTVLATLSLSANVTEGDCSITADGTRGFATTFDRKLDIIDLTTPSTPSLLASPAISNPGEDTSISPDQLYVVVADGIFGNDPLSVVDIATQSEIDTISVGTDHNAVEVLRDGTVLTASFLEGRVYKLTIDGAGTLTDTGLILSGVASVMNVYGDPSATAGFSVQNSGMITSFLVGTMMAVDTRALPGGGNAGAMHPLGTKIYARTTNGHVVAYSFDSATGALGMDPVFDVSVANSTGFFGMDQLAVTPDGSKLYVSSGNSLEVFDANTGASITTINDAGFGALTGVCFTPTVVTHVRDAPAPLGDDITVIDIEVIKQVANEVVVAGTTDADFCVAPDIREIEQRNGRLRFISRPLRLPELAGLGTCTGRLVPDDDETWEDLLAQVDLEIAPWYRSYEGKVILPDDETTLPDGSDPVGRWFVLGVIRTSAKFEGAVIMVPFPEALIDYTTFFDPTGPLACEDNDLAFRPLDLGGIVAAFGEFPNPEVESSRMIVDTAQCNRSGSLNRRTTHVYSVRLDGNARVERVNVRWQLNGIERTLIQISASAVNPDTEVAEMRFELSTARDAFAQGRFDDAIFDLEKLACIANSTDFSGVDDALEANYSGALIARSIAGAFAIHDRFIHADPTTPGWVIYLVPDGLGLPVLASTSKTSCP